MQRIKRGVAGVADWFLYTALSTRQKTFLAKFLSMDQKEKLKNTIRPGRKRNVLRRVEQVKFRLYNLGFTEKGLDELRAFYGQDDKPYLRQLAAWELALWHANRYTADDAWECINYLSVATRGSSDRTVLRQRAILEAESRHLLGQVHAARDALADALASGKHPDLYLAMANLAANTAERVTWINHVLGLAGGAPIALSNGTAPEGAFDGLYVPKATRMGADGKAAANKKVTVIMPVYNAEKTLGTSLASIQNQSWRQLEILIVDDCSTDHTYTLAKVYAEEDTRIKVLQTETNSGPYVARNTALQEASGNFVTVQDADDWSHPDKIRTQAAHLLKHAKVIGNFSQHARTFNDLTFFRRGKPGAYIFPNMSSFMFRRDPVMKALGYWDSVRFAGDSEFIKRIKLVFGEKRITVVDSKPLAFLRQSDASLTGDAAFGFPGFFMGARKAYAEAHDAYHQTHPDRLTYDFPMRERPFPVPEPMQPEREATAHGRRHLDVVIASEFRLPGGTNMSNIEEIKAQKRMGLVTGLVQLNRYEVNTNRDINPHVRALIDGDAVQLLVYGETISCDVLIIRHPPILNERQTYIPDIKAGCVRMIANQTPKREYSENGETLYELEKTDNHARAFFHQAPVWHPIGPLIRDNLYKEHARELNHINLAEDDWVNIIDVDEWRRDARPQHDVIKIGRHSRDHYVKWPDARETLLQIYPDEPAYEIHVLGGAAVPEAMLGALPENWHVSAFGDVDPKAFLRDLDVFVYYTHPDWVEAFGRVLFEAMAAGVPVIVPPAYRRLFGEAAIYAEPAKVQDTLQQLMHDDAAYQKQVDKAYTYVENHFGYSKHATRLKECLHGT